MSCSVIDTMLLATLCVILISDNLCYKTLINLVHFAGVVVTYVSQQLAYFVMWNSLLLLWGIAFPFSYRRVNSSSKMQRIHIGIVASALIAPLLSTLVYFKDGFMGGEYPVPFCVGRNTDITFYFATLPQSIMLGASTIMLILVFWLIFKVSLGE